MCKKLLLNYRHLGTHVCTYVHTHVYCRAQLSKVSCRSNLESRISIASRFARSIVRDGFARGRTKAKRKKSADKRGTVRRARHWWPTAVVGVVAGRPAPRQSAPRGRVICVVCAVVRAYAYKTSLTTRNVRVRLLDALCAPRPPDWPVRRYLVIRRHHHRFDTPERCSAPTSRRNQRS